MVKFYLTIPEAAKSGGPGRSTIYADAKKGLVKLTKFGRSTRVEVDEYRRYLDAISEEYEA